MADFKIIETQEQLDAIIGDRLKRDREARAKEYEGYTSAEDLKKIKDGYEETISQLRASEKTNAEKYADFDKKLAEKDKMIKRYETDSAKTKIVSELGLNLQAAGFVTGETEDEIRKSAEALKKLIGNPLTPLRSQEQNPDKNSGLRTMLNNLNFGG